MGKDVATVIRVAIYGELENVFAINDDFFKEIRLISQVELVPVV